MIDLEKALSEQIRVCTRGQNGKLRQFAVDTKDHASAIASVVRHCKETGVWLSAPVLAVINGGKP